MRKPAARPVRPITAVWGLFIYIAATLLAGLLSLAAEVLELYVPGAHEWALRLLWGALVAFVCIGVLPLLVWVTRLPISRDRRVLGSLSGICVSLGLITLQWEGLVQAFPYLLFRAQPMAQVQSAVLTWLGFGFLFVGAWLIQRHLS